jgi:hypothetical protein
MKIAAMTLTFVLAGCGSLPVAQGPTVSESTCSATCDAHFEQCPQVFASFPERGTVECPAEHNRCLKVCSAPAKPTRTLASSQPSAATAAGSSVNASAAKEAKLRELKHFYEEGLVSEEVYRARQSAILAEP